MKISSGHTTDFDAAFMHAIHHGWMSSSQYRFLVDILMDDPGCTLLVFGLGHDSQLWASCVDERLAFVEDDPKYLTAAPATARVVLYSYPTRVGVWSEVPELPSLIAQLWDYVLVDGPRGFHPECPGRQFPIAWARQVARRRVFVHDYERLWERCLCDTLLGSPIQVVSPTGPRRGDLAIFDAAKFSPADPTA